MTTEGGVILSQTKYKLDDDLKTSCISYVRGYERRVALYNSRRADIIYSSPSQYDTYRMDNGELARAYGLSAGGTGNPTHNKCEQLEQLEECIDTKIMRAVEQAKLTIGDDMADEPRRMLVNAIWDSCLYGRNFKLSYYPLSVESNNFYERRRRFLYTIAALLGLVRSTHCATKR